MIRTVLGSLCLICGVLAMILATYGIYHFRFVLNRMHAAAIVDAVALSLTVVGLIVLAPNASYIPKLILVLLIQWIGSPIASHMVAKLEIQTDAHAREHMTVIQAEEATSADTSAASSVNPSVVIKEAENR